MDSTFNKIFRVFALVLFAHSMFVAGAEFADNQINDGVSNLILAALWLTFLVFEWHLRGKRLKLLEKLERKSDEIFRDMAKALEAKEREQDDEIAQTLHDVTKKVVGKNKPAKSHISKIVAEFEKRLPGRYLKLDLDQKSGKFNAEVSNEPFTTAKKTPAKKPAAKKGGKK